MAIFYNLFNISKDSGYAITGLNKELNSIYLYEYFVKNNS